MVIDLILDRRASMLEGYDDYSAHDFYMACMAYGDVAEEIAREMDAGIEHYVKRALIRYILNNEYSLDIIDFVLSAWWVDKDDNKRINDYIKEKRIG